MARKTFQSDRGGQFQVRFPDGLREVIAELAEARDRSMNSEIIAAVRAHVKNAEENPALSDMPAIFPSRPPVEEIDIDTAADAAYRYINGDKNYRVRPECVRDFYRGVANAVLKAVEG